MFIHFTISILSDDLDVIEGKYSEVTYKYWSSIHCKYLYPRSVSGVLQKHCDCSALDSHYTPNMKMVPSSI